MPNNTKALETDLVIDGLHKIIAELIPSMPKRLQALTGHHTVHASVEYRGNVLSYSIDEQGEIIAMTSAEPNTPYTLGRSSIQNAMDLMAHPEHDLARGFILYWNKRIELQFSESARQLEIEHEILEKFDAKFDPAHNHLGLS